MTDARRDVEAFVRTVEALEFYLDDLVFIGGWAHYLYSLRPEAIPLAFTPLTTKDADVALPLNLAARTQSISHRLIAAGFEERLSGDHQPPVSEYRLGKEDDGFYVEFLAPLVGGAVKRGGRADDTATVAGVTVQKLRHLDILLEAPWQATVSRELGFPIASPRRILVPNPAAYLVQKVLVLEKRRPGKHAKDVLYLHDTLAVFADSFPSLRAEWQALRARLHPAHIRSFEALAVRLISRMSDLIRDAARIANDRPSAPSAEMMLAGLRVGFAGVFGVSPAELA